MRVRSDSANARRPVVVLLLTVLVLTSIPAIDFFFVLGDSWQGILPAFTDEALYHARVQTLVDGHTGGNPYFLEHTDGPPLVIFGGAWINALPQLMGLSFTTSIVLNFVFWSLMFAAVAYWLLYELRVPPWVAVVTVVLLYLQSIAHVWRPANLQPVYPFYFLFYVALVRLIREQTHKNIILMALATGTTFYLYAFMWQSAVITLGLLGLYTIVQKNWALMKATFAASLGGCVIGLPVPLYMLWLSKSSPYYWESMGRLGLVNTHLPMAEIVYSGGWIGVVLALLTVLLVRNKALREDYGAMVLVVFVSISGLGLWIMQGSNLITGKLLETGEHVRILIVPWLMFATVGIGATFWQRREVLSGALRALGYVVFAVLLGVNARFVYEYFYPFLPQHVDASAWRTQQLYAKPFAWLEAQEPHPVVVWSESHDYLTTALPIFTKHYTLHAFWGVLELVSEEEVRERYLVSQYFNNPTAASLKQDLAEYAGRQDAFHNAGTLERKRKVCQMVYFWDAEHDCGSYQTATDILGEKFFLDLESQFMTDIKPHIKDYLRKYNVTYILKDTVLNPTYRPEVLGARKVYAGDRYEIYKLRDI